MVSPSPMVMYEKNLRSVKKVHVVHLFPVGTKIVRVQPGLHTIDVGSNSAFYGLVRSSLVR